MISIGKVTDSDAMADAAVRPSRKAKFSSALEDPIAQYRTCSAPAEVKVMCS